ncbi:hypothetical protein GCM10018775_43870 [Streptomyces umbrinus]|nr:hypothetical protein GCM10018775_43870 [Streptomyces umbrinus]
MPDRPSWAPPTVDMSAGGVADGLVDDLPDGEDDVDGVADGVEEGLSSARAGAVAVAVSASENDNRVAEVTSKEDLAVFFMAGTVENVQGEGREVARCSPPWRVSPRSFPLWSSPPRTPVPFDGGDTEPMKLSRPVSWFLLAFGVWSWVIWITFVKNLWKDGSGLAFDDAGDPTGYFWVHLTLAVVSFVLGTVVGGIGLRGVRALRHTS